MHVVLTLACGGLLPAAPVEVIQTALGQQLAASPIVAMGTINGYTIAGTNKQECVFHIERVLHGKEHLADCKCIKLEKFASGSASVLILGSVTINFELKIDHRFERKAPDDLPGYVQELLRLHDTAPLEKLRAVLPHLGSHDDRVACDALDLFARAGDPLLTTLSDELPVDRLAAWVADKKLAWYRRARCARLLGYCGNQRHVPLLRGLLVDPEFSASSADLLIALMMLDRATGWQAVQAVFDQPRLTFPQRFGGLQAARFCYCERNDLVRPERVVHGMLKLLDHPDLADLVVDDLRRWQRWDAAYDVIESYEPAAHKVQRQAILRYAVSCRTQVPRAKLFLAHLPARDADMITDIEEVLKLEGKE